MDLLPEHRLAWTFHKDAHACMAGRVRKNPNWHAGGLQYDAVASLAERPSDVGEQLAALAVEHGQLSARLAEAETAERKLDALAKLQQRLADFDLLMSTGKARGWWPLSSVEAPKASSLDVKALISSVARLLCAMPCGLTPVASAWSAMPCGRRKLDTVFGFHGAAMVPRGERCQRSSKAA